MMVTPSLTAYEPNGPFQGHSLGTYGLGLGGLGLGSGPIVDLTTDSERALAITPKLKFQHDWLIGSHDNVLSYRKYR